MAFHWLMQRVYRDPKTGQILNRQKPKTMHPGQGERRMQKQPSEWKVLDTNYFVPDGPFEADKQYQWTAEDTQKTFYPKAEPAGKK